jgi:4-hydroxy-2-oxoheptanedioate aldolase
MKNDGKIPSLDSVRRFRAALDTPTGVFGPFMITSDPAFVESAGYAGYDFVLLDMEHGPGTFESLQNLIRAANVANVMTVVRVPRGSDIWIDQALDVGAGGIMIPQIDTAEQARAAVAAAKFAPRGNRGTCRYVRSAAYSAVPSATYFAEAQDTVVIVQAEGQRAVENLDEILQVEGIDIVFVGPYDLSSSLGIIGQVDHPRVMECIQDICDRAAKYNVKVGCFADNVQAARRLRSMGVRFVGYACDTAIFMRAAAADVAAFSGE